MKRSIQQRAAELGFDACRVTTALPPESAGQFQRWLDAGRHGEMGYLVRNAAKRMDPGLVLPGARSVVTLATSYFRGDAASDPDSAQTASAPTGKPATTGASPIHFTGEIARYARYEDYHEVLADRLKQLSDFITALGGDGARSLWYVDTGPLLERDIAQRAGLGFVGRHTNLISRRLGNWIFLSEILTTLKLEPDEPEKNRCGTCIRCIQACPTQAITGPFQLDARRCISYLTIELKGSIPVELRPFIGNRIYGCDDCLAVCPWNRFARESRVMAGHAREDLRAPDLIELLSLDADGFKRRFAGTPMVRTKRRGVLRNVCVALGNIGGPEALPALERAANDPEPLIAEHALWAIAEIQRRI